MLFDSKSIKKWKYNLQRKLLCKTILYKHLDNAIRELKRECEIIADESLTNKICFKMRGNLGNQLFIHAAATSIEKNRTKIIYDISECNYILNRYGIDIQASNFNYERVLKAEYIKEQSTYNLYDPEFLIKDSPYLKGYFQNEKYFSENRSKLIKEFTFPHINSLEYQNYLDKIINSNSVLLNFRVKEDYQKLGWVLDFEYQNEAMNLILKKVENPVFFVFADDIEFIRKNFKTDIPIEFVDIEKNNPDKPYIDLELMKKCKHAIIPNSSFSWWAAWLNENPDKIVIAPEPWFFKESDIVPNSWLKLKAKKILKDNPTII